MLSLHEDTLKPEIIFEDTHVIVLSKPSGLLSQSSKAGDYNLVEWARDHLGRHYVGLVHRLDRETSGLMVLAKRSKAADRLTQSLKNGLIERRYLALLAGSIKNEITFTDWLWKDEEKNLTRIVVPHTPGSKWAKTRIIPITQKQTITLAECILETGRSHQIRAQCAHHGHPLLGDSKYGGDRTYPRVALHSYLLSFPHPMTQEVLKYEVPPPADWQQLLDSES